MVSILNAVNSSWIALVVISITVVITVVDTQFINFFYRTSLVVPGTFHLLLFLSFVIIACILNTILLAFTKRSDAQATTNRPLLFRVAHVGTFGGQSAILLILLVVLFEMLFFQQYSKTSSLLVVYFSHIWPAFVLGILSLTFIQWFKSTGSFSILVYGIVFSVIVFLILVTIPLLTEQFANWSASIIPRDYATLIMAWTAPSRAVAFIYGLGNYVLPVMIVSSWILTVLLLKSYARRVSKKRFWLIVSVPLLYQLFTFIVRDIGFVNDPTYFYIIYSMQFQFFLGISYQVSGLFFSIGFLSIARKVKQKVMKSYLIISSIGIALLFSSIQPGTPFYAAYPPFGLVTVSFLGLSSYMLLVGMLGIAANVSRDSELRREIYRGLESNSDVLKKMGMAEMQRELERRVRPLMEKVRLSDEMRDRIKDPSEEEVKAMINDVLNELHAGKSKDH
jgi:hypothetical protein